MKSICMKCIRNFGDRCEAFRDEYMKIFFKDECGDFDEGFCLPSSQDIIDGEDDDSREWG